MNKEPVAHQSLLRPLPTKPQPAFSLSVLFIAMLGAITAHLPPLLFPQLDAPETIRYSATSSTLCFVAATVIGLQRRLPQQNAFTIAFVGISFPSVVFALLPRLAFPASAPHPVLLGSIAFLLSINARGLVEWLLQPWRHRSAYGWKLLALASLLGSSLITFGKLPGIALSFWLNLSLMALTHLLTAPWFIDKRRITMPLRYEPLLLWFLLIATFFLPGNSSGSSVPHVLVIVANGIALAVALHRIRLQSKASGSNP